MRAFVTALVFALSVDAVEAQVRPYLGNWRINSAKSDLSQGAVGTFTDLGNGRVQLSDMGDPGRYDVGRDGKDYPWTDGTTVTWKDVAPGHFEMIQKRDGQVINSADYRLATDGKTMTSVYRTATAAGEKPAELRNEFVRVSGGPGIFGSWRAGAIIDDTPLRIVAQGNGVRFQWPGLEAVSCQFDGQDCPFKGPASAGESMSLRETGPRGFEYVHKRGGKLLYTSRITVSDDGKTLTELETQATGEKRTIVYDRQ